MTFPRRAISIDTDKIPVALKVVTKRRFFSGHIVSALSANIRPDSADAQTIHLVGSYRYKAEFLGKELSEITGLPLTMEKIPWRIGPGRRR
jgi:hypothetical protein